MTETEIRELAERQGFEKIAILNTEELVIVQGYRKYCQENTCGNYNANYGCPPDCGDPAFMEARVRRYERVLILQTRVEVDDIGDRSLLMEVRKSHVAESREVIADLREAGEELMDRVMLPGPCSFCKICQKSFGRPCAFPEEKSSCLSAYGIDVTKMCRSVGMRIDWDGSSISYFTLILMDKKPEV